MEVSAGVEKKKAVRNDSLLIMIVVSFVCVCVGRVGWDGMGGVDGVYQEQQESSRLKVCL